MKEFDLYPPVKKLLESQGYEVKGEITQCDVVARRGEEEPVVVELKLTLNISILLQAVDRLALTTKVYLGVPKKCSVLKTQQKRILKLLRMVGLGLIAIDEGGKNSIAEVLLDPSSYQPRKNKKRREMMLREFENRKGDPNPGGVDRRKGIMTAYRQRALSIAQFLKKNEATKASLIAKELGEPKTRNILYDNVYGWFEKVGHGVYQLTEQGKKEIPQWINR